MLKMETAHASYHGASCRLNCNRSEARGAQTVEDALQLAHEDAHEGITPIGIALKALENEFFKRGGDVPIVLP
jgi:hypothetical protein